MKDAAYKTVRLTPDTIEHLDKIARSAFGVGLDCDMLLKEYDTDVFGASYIGYLALSEELDEPAAFYGVFPVELLIQGETVLAAQSGNTMTHKNHQGKGLFVTLAKKTYELAASERIQCVFGFPNKNSYPGFVRKLNWEHVNDLSRFTTKVTTFPFAHLARKYAFFKKFYSVLYRKSLSKRTYFESSVIATGGDGVKRSEAYWQYKSYSDNFTFNAAGARVWCKVDSVLFIGDIEYLENINYDLVFRKIVKRARWMGCHKIILQTSGNSWLASVAKKHLSEETGLPFGLLAFNAADNRFRALQFTLSDFDTF